MYLTYSEYQDMGGTLDEVTFNDLEFEAEALVNWYTFNRFKQDTTFPTELKRLMKYLISMAAFQKNMLSASGAVSGNSQVQGAIASQSNDGVSVSYNTLSAKELVEDIKADSKDAIEKYLNGVKNEAGRVVLYRGVYPNE